ncbi:hypothetical protein NHX12_023013 [Muraenolepis orangiensis]|uniref:Uncharacterized protein n=1 Tax=Muraenolepis orangiensis TaxID=630683 RepID=A0A9Q0ESK6_9TELE|nr:hypothetical protein NHX12_023013 [Muraenolepis orangiensis]
MVDPDGSLDAVAGLGLTSPLTPTKPFTSKPPALFTAIGGSAGPYPPIPGSLPEIMPGPVAAAAAAAAAAVVAASAPAKGQHEPARALSAVVGAMGAGLGGPPFGRIRPSGEEAIAQK